MCPDHESPARPRTRWWLLAVIAVLVIAPTLWVRTQARAEHPATEDYAFAIGPDGNRIELGSLGGKYGGAADVNDRDEVVGWALRPDGAAHAFISRAGKMTDLGTLGGGDSWATAVNNAGQVVGWALTSKGEQHAFLWQNGKMAEIGPGTGESIGAVDINEHGQVLCALTTPQATGEAGSTRAALWEKGVLTELGGFPQSRMVIPLRINDADQVLAAVGNRLFLWQEGSATELAESGYSGSDLTEQGKVYYARIETNGGTGWVGMWDSGRSTNLGALGGYLSWPTGANEAGEVVGSALVKTDKAQAFRWEDGKLTLLRVGGDASEAVAINNRGTVVGTYSYFH